MAIQSMLDGSLKLILPCTQSELVSVLVNQGERYEGFASRIEPQGGELLTTYWRTVFAILSVSSSLPSTEQAYGLCRAFPDWLGDVERTGLLLSNVYAARNQSPTLAYPKSKAKYLAAWTQDYWARPDVWQLGSNETLDGYRTRLCAIKGLRMAKASFAVALMYPTVSDVCCLDRHMLALLGVASLMEKDYTVWERRVIEAGHAAKLPGFIAQWCLWDSKRGTVEPHASLEEGES